MKLFVKSVLLLGFIVITTQCRVLIWYENKNGLNKWLLNENQVTDVISETVNNPCIHLFTKQNTLVLLPGGITVDITGRKGCDCSICKGLDNKLSPVVGKKLGDDGGGKSSCSICERKKELLRMEKEKQRQLQKCPFEILGSSSPALKGKSSQEIFDEFREQLIPSQNGFFDMMRGVVQTMHVSSVVDLKRAKEKEARELEKKKKEEEEARKQKESQPETDEIVSVNNPINPKVTVVLKQTPCGQIIPPPEDAGPEKIPLTKRLAEELIRHPEYLQQFDYSQTDKAYLDLSPDQLLDSDLIDQLISYNMLPEIPPEKEETGNVVLEQNNQETESISPRQNIEETRNILSNENNHEVLSVLPRRNNQGNGNSLPEQNNGEIRSLVFEQNSQGIESILSGQNNQKTKTTVPEENNQEIRRILFRQNDQDNRKSVPEPSNQENRRAVPEQNYHETSSILARQSFQEVSRVVPEENSHEIKSVLPRPSDQETGNILSQQSDQEIKSILPRKNNSKMRKVVAEENNQEAGSAEPKQNNPPTGSSPPEENSIQTSTESPLVKFISDEELKSLSNGKNMADFIGLNLFPTSLGVETLEASETNSQNIESSTQPDINRSTQYKKN